MSRDKGAGRRPGWWIPWCFVAFFVVVLGVNGTMIAIALGSWTGLVAEGGYDKGLAYNRNIEAARAQAALGWTGELDAAAVGAGEGRVALRLADDTGRGLEGAAVTVSFERPTHEGVDFTVALRPRGDGLYRTRFELPLEGLWKLHVKALRGEDRFVMSERVVLR